MKRWKVQHAFCLSPGRDVHPGAILTPTDITEARAKQKVNEGFIVEIPDSESKPTASAMKPPASPITTGSAPGGHETGGALGGPGGPPGVPSGLDGVMSAPPAGETDPDLDKKDLAARAELDNAGSGDKRHPNEGGGLTHRDPGPATNHVKDGAGSAPAAGGKNPAAKTAAGKGK